MKVRVKQDASSTYAPTLEQDPDGFDIEVSSMEAHLIFRTMQDFMSVQRFIREKIQDGLTKEETK